MPGDGVLVGVRGAEAKHGALRKQPVPTVDRSGVAVEDRGQREVGMRWSLPQQERQQLDYRAEPGELLRVAVLGCEVRVRVVDLDRIGPELSNARNRDVLGVRQ